MADSNKLLHSNIGFFRNNLLAYYSLRPDLKVKFKKQKNSGFSYTYENFKSGDIEEFEKIENSLIAINSAIILNCFAMFEASFEAHLLHELNTEGLSDIQEKVMQKYIENVIKLSSEAHLSKEFKFLSNKPISEFLSAKELELYQFIKSFYVVRHALIHGSTSKKVLVNKMSIELDTDDIEYQKLVDILLDKFKLEIPKKWFTINLILVSNEIIDHLFLCAIKIADAFLKDRYTTVKFIKGKPSF